MRDLLKNGLSRQTFFHQTGHEMLHNQSVNSADHDNGIKHHQERGHGATELKTAVQNNERDGEKRQPNVGAQPPLHRAHSPQRNFFPKTEQRGENKNPERDRTESQSERCPAHSVMLSRRLNQ